ncbi:hypothetical protein [Hyphomicrobium sp.]|uniref:tetratricopeptide repeat protein n=1 Tax=Hyphomicrobium sp. TaxID=82 RepID=UPI002E37DF39|nr:hypothetical protein [Hyphomicrobium sp.]HEX2843478.1 hypothetical protein [Hyphomicrobium sp.]
MSLNSWSESDQQAIREQLDRILKSGPFHQSRRRQRFLEYIVTETLAGRSDRLKGYTVAVEVFERPETFDPLVNPMVRIEAARLRDKLREYYEIEGRDDPIRIDLPKGCYAPHIEFRQATDPAATAKAPENNKHDPSPPPVPNAVAAPQSARAWWGPISSWQFAVAAAILFVAVIATGVWRWAAVPQFEKASIAVLPFENFGGDPKWERLADGMTEDIITDLSHSKDLFVVARSSTEIYKNNPADIRKVGSELGVHYVLEGSIQPIDDQIRATAQLIDATTGTHVWSSRYDRPTTDLFNLQSEITERIAATLTGYEGAVAEAERALVKRKPPRALTAYDTYLLGMEAKHKVTKESLIEADGLFRKALELDPQLARAYCGLATVQVYMIDLGLAPSVDDAVAKQMEYAAKAVELDPNDGETHLVLGTAYAYQGKAEQALAEFDRAETLAPSKADLLLIIAWSLPGFGQSERAVNLAERSLKLNPHYPDWYNQGLSLVFFFGGQYERAVKYRLLVKEPVALDYAFLAMSYGYLNRKDATDAAAAKVKTLDPSWTAERYLSEAGGYADREAELFIGGARKAGLQSCVPAGQLSSAPNLVRVKSCDLQRGTQG